LRGSLARNHWNNFLTPIVLRLVAGLAIGIRLSGEGLPKVSLIPDHSVLDRFAGRLDFIPLP